MDQYRIVINMRVAAGFIETGNFFIGNDRDVAMKLFSEMKGRREVVSTCLLRLDFIESFKGIDIILHSLECSLGEMGYNVRMIIKETFKRLNLE